MQAATDFHVAPDLSAPEARMRCPRFISLWVPSGPLRAWPEHPWPQGEVLRVQDRIPQGSGRAHGASAETRLTRARAGWN